MIRDFLMFRIMVRIAIGGKMAEFIDEYVKKTHKMLDEEIAKELNW